MLERLLKRPAFDGLEMQLYRGWFRRLSRGRHCGRDGHRPLSHREQDRQRRDGVCLSRRKTRSWAAVALKFLPEEFAGTVQGADDFVSRRVQLRRLNHREYLRRSMRSMKSRASDFMSWNCLRGGR